MLAELTVLMVGALIGVLGGCALGTWLAVMAAPVRVRARAMSEVERLERQWLLEQPPGDSRRVA